MWRELPPFYSPLPCLAIAGKIMAVSQTKQSDRTSCRLAENYLRYHPSLYFRPHGTAALAFLFYPTWLCRGIGMTVDIKLALYIWWQSRCEPCRRALSYRCGGFRTQPLVYFNGGDRAMLAMWPQVPSARTSLLSPASAAARVGSSSQLITLPEQEQAATKKKKSHSQRRPGATATKMAWRGRGCVDDHNHSYKSTCNTKRRRRTADVRFAFDRSLQLQRCSQSSQSSSSSSCSC